MSQKKIIITATLLLTITSIKMYAGEEYIILRNQKNEEDKQQTDKTALEKSQSKSAGQAPLGYIAEQATPRFDTSSPQSRSRSQSTDSTHTTDTMNSRSTNGSIDVSSFGRTTEQKPFQSMTEDQVKTMYNKPQINHQEAVALTWCDNPVTSADGTITTYTYDKISVTVDNATGKILKSNASKTLQPHNTKSMFAADRMTNQAITGANNIRNSKLPQMLGTEKNAVINGKRTVNAENGTTTFSYKGVDLVIDTNTLKIVRSNAKGSEFSGKATAINHEALPSYQQSTHNAALPAYKAPTSDEIGSKAVEQMKAANKATDGAPLYTPMDYQTILYGKPENNGVTTTYTYTTPDHTTLTYIVDNSSGKIISNSRNNAAARTMPRRQAVDKTSFI